MKIIKIEIIKVNWKEKRTTTREDRCRYLTSVYFNVDPKK